VFFVVVLRYFKVQPRKVPEDSELPEPGAGRS
jgi:hypothetical protein